MQYAILEKVIYLLFFISGACGLIYEVIWGKYLSLFIGNTTHAHMIVLATFMGGLAAGSFVFGRVADQVGRPLKIYAWLEIGIGFYGVLYSPLLEFAKDIYFNMAADLQFGGFAHTLVKLPLAFFTIIFPTFLMGGTLPILSRFFIRSLGSVGKRVALLYFINSFGAVAGTLIAGFYTVEALGLKLGLLFTGMINVLAGIIIMVVDIGLAKQPAGAAETDDEAQALYEPGLVNLAMAGIFISGFTSMIYELVWFRVFAVVLESSTYSFSLMLAAFITGITAGSLVAGHVMARIRRLIYLFGVCEIAIAAAVILSLPLYERLPYYFWSIRYVLRPVVDTFTYYNTMKFLLCFAIMLVPTLFFGMTLPLVSNIASTRFTRLARNIGNVYATNTAGTLLGALFTGMILIPLLGLGWSLSVAFILNLTVGVGVVYRASDAPSQTWRLGIMTVVVVILLPYWGVFGQWNNDRFALGLFRNRGAPPPTYAEFLASPLNDYNVEFYTEDLNSNVAVLEHPLPEGGTKLSLTVNGKVDASSQGDVPTQILLGQLPLMLKDNASDVLIVGFGSGMTAGTAIIHPLNTLDCLEISPGVAEAGKLFAPFNNDVLNHPKFRLMVGDAKTYIKTTAKKYDVVISEPSNPWMAGVGNLFSVEFFLDVEKVLKPDGVVVQWFHRYEIDDEIVATVVRTFQAVFPYTYIFQGNSFDMIMLGSRQRIEPDFDAITARFENPDIKRELEDIHVYDTASLLALQMISPEYVSRVASPGDINSDYRPVIEYRAPMAFFTGNIAGQVGLHDERMTVGEHLMLTRYLRDHPLTADQYKNLILFFRSNPTDNDALSFALLSHYLSLRPDDTRMKQVFAEMTRDQRKDFTPLLNFHYEGAEAADTLAMEQYADLLYTVRRPFHTVFTPQRFEETISYFQRCLQLAPDNERYLIKLGRASFIAGRNQEALSCLLEVARLRETTPDAEPYIEEDELYTLIGRVYFQAGDYAESLKNIDRAFKLNPENVNAAYYMVMLDQMARFQAYENEQAR